jgi:hypothetical protein
VELRNIDEALGRERVREAPRNSTREMWVRRIVTIREDLYTLAVNRMAWRALSEVWRDRKPPLPLSLIFECFGRTYGDTQVAGIPAMSTNTEIRPAELSEPCQPLEVVATGADPPPRAVDLGAEPSLGPRRLLAAVGGLKVVVIHHGPLVRLGGESGAVQSRASSPKDTPGQIVSEVPGLCASTGSAAPQ